MYVYNVMANWSSLTSILQPRDDVYGAYDASYLQNSGPNQHTQQPVVTGTSVVALKFKEGVVIAADNLGATSPFPDHNYAALTRSLTSIIRIPCPLH